MSIEELTDEEVLQNFLLDIECLDELRMWTEKFNIFDVLKISRAEIRHSNMLAWLFDANENHGLGDKFAKKIMQKFVENNLNGKFDVFEILLLDFYSFNIYREWNNIDLLFVSEDEETVIAIENKVGSHEHSNQLDRYRKFLEKAYPNYNKIYIFLTPDGLLPSDTDNWCVLTYSDIAVALSDIKDMTELLPDVELIIDNYIDVIRRDILDDQQLIEICNRIYNKHRRALDLIYQNRTDIRSLIRDEIRDTLLLLADEGKIIFDGNRTLRFYTQRLNQIVPVLPNADSEWKTIYPYVYCVEITGENRISILLEFCSKNLAIKDIEVLQSIFETAKPNEKKRDKFEWKRLYRINVDVNSDNVVENINNKLTSAIDKLLVWEEKLIKDYTEKINNEQLR